MMTVPVSSWAFSFLNECRSSVGMSVGNTIRKARFATACCLMLTYALVAGVVAQDSSKAGDKAAATKKASSTHHKSSSATSKATSSKTSPSSKRSSRKKKSSRSRGQQKIDSERAEEIQEALIREHYLSGTATGTWNQASEEAMRRYQADNGWQSKTVPDSRALIKLGLGPSKDHLLNPESAMTTVPAPPKADPAAPTSHTSPTAATPVPAGSPPSPTPTSDSSSPQ